MSVHFNGNFKEQKISEKSVHSLVYNQWMCSSVFSYLSDSAPCWLILFKLFDRIGLLGCWGPCSSSLDASVCYTFCTTWTKDVLSLQFGWQGQYQHPHTQVSLMSRTNRMPQTEMICLMVSAIYFVAVCFPKMSETRPFLNKDLKFFLGSIVSRIRTNWEACCLDAGFVQVMQNLESHGI